MSAIKEQPSIQSTCGECPRKSVCEFGAPALKTIEVGRSKTEINNVVVYLWNKRSDRVVEKCPTPGEIDQVVFSLQEGQR